MTSLRAASEVLKQDTRGRVRVSAERREGLLAEFEQSGLSGAKFARMVGVKYATFANWVAQRRQRRTGASEGDGRASGDRPIRLLEAVMESGTSRFSTVEGLAVELPGGSRVEVGSPVQLAMAAELVVLVAQGMRNRC